jgi:hypothetical protein
MVSGGAQIVFSGNRLCVSAAKAGENLLHKFNFHRFNIVIMPQLCSKGGENSRYFFNDFVLPLQII